MAGDRITYVLIPGAEGASWYLASIGLSPGAADDLAILFFHDVPDDVAEEGSAGSPLSRPRRSHNPSR
jgi:hypothetical protein